MEEVLYNWFKVWEQVVYTWNWNDTYTTVVAIIKYSDDIWYRLNEVSQTVLHSLWHIRHTGIKESDYLFK